MTEFTDLEWAGAVLEHARAGDYDSAKEALRLIEGRINEHFPTDPLFRHLAAAINDFLVHGKSLEKGLGVEPKLKKRGRPSQFSPLEIASADIILRVHCGMRPEQSLEWLDQHFQIERRAVQRLRKQFDAAYNKKPGQLSESLPLEILLLNAGPMQSKLSESLR